MKKQKNSQDHLKKIRAFINRYRDLYDNTYSSEWSEVEEVIDDSLIDHYNMFCEDMHNQLLNDYIDGLCKLEYTGNGSDFYIRPMDRNGLFDEWDEDNITDYEILDRFENQVGSRLYVPYKDFEDFIATINEDFKEPLKAEDFEMIANDYFEIYETLDEYIDDELADMETELKHVEDAVNYLEDVEKNQLKYWRDFIGDEELYTASLKELRAIINKNVLPKLKSQPLQSTAVSIIVDHNDNEAVVSLPTRFIKNMRSHVNTKLDDRILLHVVGEGPDIEITYVEKDKSNDFYDYTFEFMIYPQLSMSSRLSVEGNHCQYQLIEEFDWSVTYYRNGDSSKKLTNSAYGGIIDTYEGVI